MKKTITVVLAAFLLLAAAGCTATGKPVETDTDITNYAAYILGATKYPDRLICPVYDDFIDSTGKLDEEAFKAARESFQKRFDNQEEDLALNRQLKDFCLKMMQSLMEDPSDNSVFSPANLYFNFVFLSSMVQGESRKELLDLLGVNESTLLEDYQRQWKDNTLTGRTTVDLANSIWLANDFAVKEEAIRRIAMDYYAPIFSGETGTEKYDKAFQSWLNENTGNLLREQVADLHLEKGIRMALASTIYFKGSYGTPYQKQATAREVFHGTKGDKETDMMHKSYEAWYLENDLFKACVENLGEAEMILILPQESIYQLDGNRPMANIISSSQFSKIIFESDDISEDFNRVRLNISLPAFDVTSKADLEEILPSLGVNGIFGADPKAFGVITDEELYVDKIEHACRVKANEEGVEAAAYTVEGIKATAFLEKEEVITFNRPFIFVIRSAFDHTVLFCGTVNNAN